MSQPVFPVWSPRGALTLHVSHEPMQFFAGVPIFVDERLRETLLGLRDKGATIIEDWPTPDQAHLLTEVTEAPTPKRRGASRQKEA